MFDSQLSLSNIAIIINVTLKSNCCVLRKLLIKMHSSDFAVDI